MEADSQTGDSVWRSDCQRSNNQHEIDGSVEAAAVSQVLGFLQSHRCVSVTGLLGCLYVTVRVHLQVIVLQCAGFWGVLEPNSEISIAPFPVIQRRHSRGFGSGTNGD